MIMPNLKNNTANIEIGYVGVGKQKKESGEVEDDESSRTS